MRFQIVIYYDGFFRYHIGFCLIREEKEEAALREDALPLYKKGRWELWHILPILIFLYHYIAISFHPHIVTDIERCENMDDWTNHHFTGGQDEQGKLKGKGELQLKEVEKIIQIIETSWS